MSRAGLIEDCEDLDLTNLWRGAVNAALRGKRGQAFLRELVVALDALPEKRLISDALEADGAVCALGSVGRLRGVDLSTLDPEDAQTLSNVFGVAEALIRELEYMNDEWDLRETPEHRWQRMRDWAVAHIADDQPAPSGEVA